MTVLQISCIKHLFPFFKRDSLEVDIPQHANVVFRRAEEVSHFMYWSTMSANYLKKVSKCGHKVTYAYYRKEIL